MLDRLVIDGAVVSIDAMGTQVDIAEKIVGKNAHYFLAVKEDQAGLFSETQDVTKYSQPTSTYSVTEKGHASVETRAVSIYPADMMEDKCRARKKNAAQNLPLLRKLALQIATHTQDKLSVRKRLRCASWNPKYLITLLKNYGF